MKLMRNRSSEIEIHIKKLSFFVNSLIGGNQFLPDCNAFVSRGDGEQRIFTDFAPFIIFIVLKDVPELGRRPRQALEQITGFYSLGF